MGFDVLYLPPIHPIGTTKRKGRNNALVASPGDPGSPWAIGARRGRPQGDPSGARHARPTSGSLVEAARAQRIEIALDIAFQTSPDHPYVNAHPQWFGHRPDGTIQFAENPPKKYEDIYPFDFESADWKALWQELLERLRRTGSTHGVRVFRVDNPHTKPFPMWEWIIGEIKARAPGGRVPRRSLHAAAPDAPARQGRLLAVVHVLHVAQHQGRAHRILHRAFEGSVARLLPAQRVAEHAGHPDRIPADRAARSVHRAARARRHAGGELRHLRPGVRAHGAPAALEAGSEEYLDSEKYEIRAWDREREDSLRTLIARLNAIRRANAALHCNERLEFHDVDNEQLICYSKTTEDFDNVVLVVVNLDPRNAQSGWTSLALDELGLEDDETFEVHDLLTDARYRWTGARNYVELRPQEMPAHVFLVTRTTPQ